LDAIDALITGLAAYKGGVLLVSHDQHFISAVADELWCGPRAVVRARGGWRRCD
jgi:ATP-binding cassette subfamily F protein 3